MVCFFTSSVTRTSKVVLRDLEPVLLKEVN